MKSETVLICLACAMDLCAKAALPQNPYAPIAARNVFNLNPPQLVAPAPVEPPAKITANGIMTIFGQVQALFKVAGTAKPGQPPKDTSYILSEGQRQDDIEVVRIDQKNGTITFNNHGVTQEIPLTKAPALTISTPSAPPPNRMMPTFVPPPSKSGGNSSSASINSGNRFGRGGFENRNGNQPAPSGQNNFNNGYRNSNVNAPAKQIDPVEQEVIIAAQHAHALQTGDPTAAIYPPTSLDNEAGIPPSPVSSQNNSTAK